MFSTNKYSKRTISTFEIIGSFVVDVYYNHLYHEAKKLHAFGKVESTTDGYKCAMSTYIKSLSHPDHYKKTLLGVHRYYSTTTKFTSITFSDCMNSISKQFMPEDLHESMSESQKDGMIRVVLSAAIKNFSVEILKGKLLKMIIDDHESEGIVRVLQDAMVECLVFEREKMYQKIFSTQNGVSTDAGVTSKMRKRIEELTVENKQLAVANERLTAKNKALDQYVNQCLTMLKKQKEIMGARGEIPRPELRQFSEEPRQHYEEPQPMESQSHYGESRHYEEPRQPTESQSRYEEPRQHHEETRRHRAEPQPQQHQPHQHHQQQYCEEPRHSEPVKYNAPARWDAPAAQQPLFEQHLPREQQEWEEPAEESVEDQTADDGFLNIE